MKGKKWLAWICIPALIAGVWALTRLYQRKRQRSKQEAADKDD